MAVASISSVGAWTDVALDDLASVTSESIPTSGVRYVEIVVRETSGTAPAYVLLRAEDGEAASAAEAIQIPASSTMVIPAYLSLDIDTIAIYGSAALTATLV